MGATINDDHDLPDDALVATADQMFQRLDREEAAGALRPEDAEALAIRDLLKTRMRGPTISHEEVEAMIAQRRKRIQGKG
jgi:hypothetical protein